MVEPITNSKNPPWGHIPKDFANIGISLQLPHERIVGQVYQKPEDFVVKEVITNLKSTCQVTQLKKDVKNKFIHATLLKKDISTFEACGQLAKANNLDYEKISYYGLKDTCGITSQQICFENHKLSKTRFKKFYIKNITFANWNIKTNTHAGNKFKIKVRDIKANQTTRGCIKKFMVRADRGIPNFYGPQRFGVRQNNHLLGKLLLNQDYEKFVYEFLTQSKNESADEITDRNELKQNFGEWKKCLSIAESNSKLNDETDLLTHLSAEKNYLIAIKRMKIARFFPHAYSSFIFNQALSKYLVKNETNCQLEKIGCGAIFNSTTQQLFKDVLKKEGISMDTFKHPVKEFRVKSHSRAALFFPKDLRYKLNKTNLIIEFTLGTGEYASVVLGFLVKGAFWKLD